MSARRWAPWWVALLGGVTACSLMVGEADLASVQCMQEGVVGPPACKDGQACLAGRCQQCSAVEACGDNLDNDCNGKPDDGCSAAGSGGSAGQAGAEQGGSAGMDASPDQSVGGSSGHAGEGGGAGQGGAAGQGGEAGASGGGTGGGAAGEGGGAGGSAGGQAGTGGQPPLSAMGESCQATSECAAGLFCAPDGVLKNTCTRACCTSADCNKDFVCIGTFGGGACAFRTIVSSEPLGLGPAGATCKLPSECRSGRCVGERCNDTCCVQSDCASGTNCAVRDDDTSIWECQAFDSDHTESTGSPCTGGYQCKSNLCLITCLAPCSNDDDCMVYCSYHSILGARACSLTAEESPSLCGTNADCGGQLCTPSSNNRLHCP